MSDVPMSDAAMSKAPMSDVLARRRFLGGMATGAAATIVPVLPCARLRSVGRLDATQDDEYLEDVPFLRERRHTFGKATGEGLSGRLAFDLSSLDEEDLVVPQEKFFIRTRKPDGLDYSQRSPWKIRINGLVEEDQNLDLAALLPHVADKGECLLECSGNGRQGSFGLLSATDWTGVDLAEVLRHVTPAKTATCVRISGVDSHSVSPRFSPAGASWIMRFDEIEKYKPFLATEMGGTPLTEDHGKPVRLVIPGWYGCTCIKWVDEITLLDDTAKATGQMKEFASRTHQDGQPELAKDFRPAAMDLAAMPVRIEKWKNGSGIYYRIVGIVWGGERTTDALKIRFNREAAVDVEFYEHTTNATWSLWSHNWTPTAGRYRIRLLVDDPAISTRRLDRGYYDRAVEIA